MACPHRPIAIGIHATAGCFSSPTKANLIRFASFRFAKYLLTPFHGVLAPNAKLRFEIIPGSKKNKSNASNASDAVTHSSASVRISWARLLKRVFEIDIEHCSHCGGNMKIISAILERVAITKILNHLGLPAEAPPRSPAKIQGLFGPS